MCEINQTEITQFQLLGFQGPYGLKCLLFVGCLFSYIVILVGNFLTVTLVTIDDHLKIPMYFFLKHLAIADFLVTTSIMPMILQSILIEERTLSRAACFTQLYIFLILWPLTNFIILTMAYDRFLAICIPLRYASLMTPQVCLQIVIGSWFLSVLLMTSEMIVVCQFSYCGFKNTTYIDHFYCEFGEILQLATSEKSSFLVYDLLVNIFLMPSEVSFIAIIYICICVTILKIPSATGRKKAFSTCSSHLATVCTSYGSLITVFFVPSNYRTANINKYLSLLCILVTPMMNPIIYSLRSKEIRRAFLKLLTSIVIRF